MQERKMTDPTIAEVEFLRSELHTGLTLTRIALDASNRDKTDRNSANARKAYDAVLRFIPKVSLSNDETTELRTKLDQLKAELQMLGEEI